jgi:hypothetical protein
MAFSVRHWDIPAIRSYDEAKDKFHKDTPIRGGDQSIRRFVSRTDKTKWLKHEIIDGVDVYKAGLHESWLVAFYPTHYEITMGGWGTASTINFIRGVTGVWVQRLRTADYIPKGFNLDIPAGYTYRDYPINGWERYKFGYDHTPLEPEKHPKLVKYKVNRKRMNEVRKVAKPFYEYIDAMHNLTGDTISEDIDWSHPYRNTATLISYIEDQDKWWEMFEVLSWQTQERYYDYALRKPMYKRNVANMKQCIDNALKESAPHVLDVVN